MSQRQLNMIQSAQEGIAAAREELEGLTPVRKLEKVAEVMAREFPWDDEDYRPMSLGRASYLACFFLAWKDLGSPDIFG